MARSDRRRAEQAALPRRARRARASSSRRGVAGRLRPGRATSRRSGRGFTDAVSRLAAATRRRRIVRFPPLLPRYQLETNGYLGSFPHLAGSVFSFDGDDADGRRARRRAPRRHEDWSELQTMTDLVLLPAACYPVYPEIAQRGPLPRGRRDRRHGRRVGLPARAVGRSRPGCRSFHMREIVRIGEPRGQSPRAATSGCDRAVELLRAARARRRPRRSPRDPFFGRGGRMLAANQREQELKFELGGHDRRPGADGDRVLQLPPGPLHARSTTSASRAAASPTPACVGFGLERITLALFRAHGLDVGELAARGRRGALVR